MTVELYSKIFKEISEYQKTSPDFRFSFPCFHGGETNNVIPDYCEFKGTARVFTKQDEDFIVSTINQLTAEIAQAAGCKHEIEYGVGGEGAVINNEECAQFVRRLAVEQYGAEQVGNDLLPSYASEDFADFLKVVPGCFFFRVIDNLPQGVGLHCSHYNFDDSVIEDVSKFWLNIVVTRCNEK